MKEANLVLRFLLELAALAGLGAWAWHAAAGWWRIAFSLLIILVVTALWGIFAVPNDPSRSGAAPVPVPGALRLLLELTILFGGAYAWHLGGHALIAIVSAALIALHYALSFDRIVWLLRQ